jgi:CO/xanthine dehydrogenase Mo-binding subunit
MYSNAYSASVAEVEVDRKTCIAAETAGECARRGDGAQSRWHAAADGRLHHYGTGLRADGGSPLQFKDGAVLDRNFDTYSIPRFSWLPKIETILLDNPENPPLGGEPPIITMGAVIANATYDAVGVRLRQLPMTPERVFSALRTA